MTDKEILEKAIQKAIDGGWRPIGKTDKKLLVIVVNLEPLNGYFEVYIGVNEGELFIMGGHSHIIFNHDFAKALWGEKKILKEEIVENGAIRTYYSQEKDWKEHLRLMVIADNRIQYLGEHM